MFVPHLDLHPLDSGTTLMAVVFDHFYIIKCIVIYNVETLLMEGRGLTLGTFNSGRPFVGKFCLTERQGGVSPN